MPVIATNTFREGGNVLSPPNNAFAVVPSDADELACIARELFVGVAGDVSVIHAGDTVAVVYKNVQGLLCGFFKQVKSTGTTATNIIARY